MFEGEMMSAVHNARPNVLRRPQKENSRRIELGFNDNPGVQAILICNQNDLRVDQDMVQGKLEGDFKGRWDFKKN